MEEIERSIALLYTSQPGSNEQKEANAKLLALQRTNEAWQISLQLVSSSPAFQIQLFGAQTLILKIHEHWSSLDANEKAKVPPALLSEIHSFLSQGKVAKEGGHVVMEKLTKAYAASCVRTFPVSYPSFVSDVSNLLSASPQNPTVLKAVVDIFRHFPEEMGNIHISSGQRGNMENQFLAQASEKLISIGRFCLLERGREGGEWEGVRATVFMCMGIWLEHLAVGEELIQALFAFIPAAVQAILADGGQGENEGALEFLLAYFSVLPASDANTFQNVLEKISPLFTKYDENKDDEEASLDLMRVFVRVSSQFCSLFLTSSVNSLPPVVRSLLGAILDGTVGESSSVSAIGLEFWKSFGRAAADSSSFPSSTPMFSSASLSSSAPEKSSASSKVAAEYFQALLPSLLKKCTYPEDFNPKEGGVPLLLNGNDPSDFDYSDFKIYRDSASVVLKQGADSIGIDAFFSLLSSHISSSSSSPDWRRLESVIFAANCIIKLLFAHTHSPSSSATSYSLSSSLGSSPSAAPLPLPQPFLEILHKAISSPVFPLLTITSLKMVGNFGSLFSGQFEMGVGGMGGAEVAFRCVAFMFEAMKVPALVSGACDAFKKVTTHAAQWLLPHCQSILEHSFSSELHHLSKFPQAKTDLFTGVVAVLRAATPEQIMGAMEGIVPAFGASLNKLVERSGCLYQQAHGHMEELKLAMVQEEVEVAVVEELRVVKAVVEAMEGVGGGRMIGGLWPLLKEVGMRWRGSEDVVESFSTLCVSILQMLLPTPKQLETEEGREQGRLMEGVMKDMVSYFMSSYEEYYFACCLVVLSSLLKQRYNLIKKRGGEGGNEVIQQWRTLCESCTRLSFSYVEICGNPEGEVDLIKGVFDFLFCTVSTTQGEAFPHTIVPLVIQLSGVALPFATRECLRSIVSTLSSLVNLRSRPSSPTFTHESKLLWDTWDSMWLGDGEQGGVVMKHCFLLLPTAFQLNATRRIAGLLRSLMMSYPEKRNMWIEQGINLFDDALFRDFGKPRAANAFLSSLQHERKFNVFMSDFGRVLNQEVDDSVLIAYEVPA